MVRRIEGKKKRRKVKLGEREREARRVSLIFSGAFGKPVAFLLRVRGRDVERYVSAEDRIGQFINPRSERTTPGQAGR